MSFLKAIGLASKNISYNCLSDAAKTLVTNALGNITHIYDMHTHLGGSETEITGCCAHKKLLSPLYPVYYTQQVVMKAATGMVSDVGCDQEYVDTLVTRTYGLTRIPNKNGEHVEYRHLLLAMSQWYDEDGTARPDLTSIYIPNEYVWDICRNYDMFDMCVSIHPANPNAIAQLDAYHNLGARAVKWLPNSMGIHPGKRQYSTFYERMLGLGMFLVCHLGDEHVVTAGGVDQELGNPLHLRLPLSIGLRIIGAHCASEGMNIDYDSPENHKVSNFSLFLRLVKEYPDRMFGDISSMLLYKRIGVPLTTMLDRVDLHCNLVFGSDYPVPAIGYIQNTTMLAVHGYITMDEKVLLDEIYQVNPILFDFVAKRIVRSPNTGNVFSDEIFGRNAKLFGKN